MKDSKLFSLGLKDLFHGLVMAALTPVATIVYQSLNSGSLVLDYHTLGMASLTGGAAYLFKKFFNGQSNTPQ